MKKRNTLLLLSLLCCGALAASCTPMWYLPPPPGAPPAPAWVTVIPPAPSADYLWVPAYYDGRRWIRGFWRPAARAGSVWVARRWTGAGWRGGYWRPRVVRTGNVWRPGHYSYRTKRWVGGSWVVSRPGRRRCRWTRGRYNRRGRYVGGRMVCR